MGELKVECLIIKNDSIVFGEIVNPSILLIPISVNQGVDICQIVINESQALEISNHLKEQFGWE